MGIKDVNDKHSHAGDGIMLNFSQQIPAPHTEDGACHVHSKANARTPKQNQGEVAIPFLKEKRK